MKDEEKTKEQLIKELNEARQRIVQLQSAKSVKDKIRASVILDALSDMMFLLSEDGIFLDYYAPKYNPLYADPSEFLGKRLDEVMPRHVVSISMESLEKVISTGERQIYEYHLDIAGYERLYFMASMVSAGNKEVLVLIRDITRRKQAEEKLLASEARWRSLVENAPNILFEFDRNGIIQFINHVVEGMTVEDVIGTSLYEFTLADRRESVKGFIEQVIQTGEPISYETPGIDGEWYSVRIGAVKRGEEIVSLMMILTNITDLKQSQLATQKSVARLRTYSSALPDPAFIIDDEGCYIDVLASDETLLYTSSDEIIGHKISEIFSEENAEEFLAFIHETLSSQKVQTLEYAMTVPIGTRWFEGRAAPVLSDEDEYVVFVARDITKRKLAEENLQKSEARLRSLLNAFPDIAFIIDSDLKIIDVLTSQEALLSAPIDKLIGESVNNSSFPELAQQISDSIYEALKTKEVQSIEYELEVQVGHRWFEGRVAPMPSIEGDNELVVFVARDITERWEVELKLSKSKEIIALKDSIIETVAHEFRTPLSVIETASTLLRRYQDKLGDARKKELFEQIHSEIEVLTKLINDMLSVRPTSFEELQNEPIELELVPFCQAIFDKCQTDNTMTHQFEFISHYGPDSSLVFEEARLDRILTNLLSNAVKFSPDGGQISLELREENQHIVFIVSDEGIGIPEDEQAYIFELFRRASNVDNIRGIGLGLSIAKHMVDFLGGSIKVESKLGKGSRFTIRLPIIQ